MREISIQTLQHSQMIDITDQVRELVPSSLTDGVCQLFVRHTTAALTLNVNTDTGVRHDLLSVVNRLAPWKDELYQHQGGNSAAHFKASLFGASQTIPVRNGQLLLGRWQSIYLCEFDGPRDRKIIVQFLPGLTYAS